MSNIKTELILKELQKRAAEAQKASAVPAFTLDKFCFDKQLSFIRDPSLFKTAVCSRRAGKTLSCAADLIDTLISQKNRVDLAYITLTLGTAKRIIWRELIQINNDYKLNLVPNNTELTLTNPITNSILYLSGAKDAQEIEKFRGMSLKKVYLDESQSFRPYIKELVDDIIIPATWDVSGTVCLIGTPGPVRAGFFYEACHSDGWKNYKWNIFDNPFIKLKSGKEPEEILKAERKRKGITESDPTYMREALGLWVQDTNKLVYKFDPALNVFKQAPTEDLIYIFGIDTGFEDADAIAVLGYSYTTNKVYLVEEHVENKQDWTDLSNTIRKLQQKYKPVKIVIDPAAGGKKFGEELTKRYQIAIEVAEKSRKHEFIELLNDDLRTGKFLALPQSKFQHDCGLVMWEYTDTGKREVSDSYHTDIGDSVLYAWRACNHFIPRTEAFKAPDKNTQAYMDALEQKEADALEAAMRPSDDFGIVDQDDLESLFS